MKRKNISTLNDEGLRRMRKSDIKKKTRSVDRRNNGGWRSNKGWRKNAERQNDESQRTNINGLNNNGWRRRMSCIKRKRKSADRRNNGDWKGNRECGRRNGNISKFWKTCFVVVAPTN